MLGKKVLPVAFAFMALGSMPASAMGWFSHSHKHHGPPVSHSAPGPIIGLGLPGALAFGGYLWFRRRTRKDRNKD